jgi:hypothetical protein
LKCKVFFKKLGGMKVRRQHLSVIFANSLPFVFLNFVSLVLVCYQKNQYFFKTTLSFVIEPNMPDCFLSRTKTTFLFIPKRGSPKNTKHLLLNFISVTVSKWPKSVQSSTMASGISWKIRWCCCNWGKFCRQARSCGKIIPWNRHH